MNLQPMIATTMPPTPDRFRRRWPDDYTEVERRARTASGRLKMNTRRLSSRAAFGAVIFELLNTGNFRGWVTLERLIEVTGMSRANVYRIIGSVLEAGWPIESHNEVHGRPSVGEPSVVAWRLRIKAVPRFQE